MSNVTPFVVGLGSGLALWRLTRRKSSAEPTHRNAAGPCVITLDPDGIAIDDERVDLAEAVRRAQLAGLALVTVVPDAPASTCAALFEALRDAAVPTHAATPRNATDLRTDFTLRVYPQGSTSTSTERYFRAEAPISWSEARDRLATAGLVDLALAGRTSEPGGWMLSIDRTQFHADRAEPLPGAPRNSYISTTFTLTLYPEGVGGPKTTRWFSSSSPVSWDDAAERLADAGLIDPSVTLATHPGYWILVSAPGPFNASKAEPLPARKRRRRNAESATAFTLVTYPDGAWGSRKTTRWFRTNAPMTWEAARDQLAAAGVIDKNAISPHSAGYWKLVTDRRVFMPSRAEALPDQGTRDAAPKRQFTLEGGRTILRDGEAIVRIERVDLGDGRYVLSPFETDQLAARIVRLLAKHGAR
jgi:hypothetical protein